MSQVALLKKLILLHHYEMHELVCAVTEFYKSRLPFEHQNFYICKSNENLYFRLIKLDADYNPVYTDYPFESTKFASIAIALDDRLSYSSHEVIKLYKNYQLNCLFEKYLYPKISSEFTSLFSTKYISFKDEKMSYYDSNRGFWKEYNKDIYVYIITFRKYNYENKGLTSNEIEFINKFEQIVASIAKSSKSGIYYSKGEVYKISFKMLEQVLKAWQ